MWWWNSISVVILRSFPFVRHIKQSLYPNNKYFLCIQSLILLVFLLKIKSESIDKVLLVLPKLNIALLICHASNTTCPRLFSGHVVRGTNVFNIKVKLTDGEDAADVLAAIALWLEVADGNDVVLNQAVVTNVII